jgi:hypothetical protein
MMQKNVLITKRPSFGRALPVPEQSFVLKTGLRSSTWSIAMTVRGVQAMTQMTMMIRSLSANFFSN